MLKVVTEEFDHAQTGAVGYGVSLFNGDETIFRKIFLSQIERETFYNETLKVVSSEITTKEKLDQLAVIFS